MSALAAVADYAEWVSTHRAEFADPQTWQRKLIHMTGQFPHVMVSAGNQTGKTWAVSYAARCHLTGKYPEWWNGATFAYPRRAWAAGVDWKQIGRVWTKALLGNYNQGSREFDFSGVLSPEDVTNIKTHMQHRESAESITIKHSSGRTVQLEMIAYSQTGAEKKQAQSLAGTTNLDLLLVDEQPPDMALGQMVQRTMHGRHINGQGATIEAGHILIGMTPELGATPMYEAFASGNNPRQGFLNVTWDDCDERVLNPEQKEIILSSIPPWQRDMRSKGIPVRGSGLVYPVDEEILLCDPFEIPGYWRQVIGIDFGFNNFGIAKVAHDPDSDCIYVTNALKLKEQTPIHHVATLKGIGAATAGSPGIPTITPHDGEGTEKDGDTLVLQYQSAGLRNTIPFRNPDGTILVNPGVSVILERMTTGQLRIFRTCAEAIQEIRQYHRHNGKIVKENDHVMDAMRYAAGMVQQVGSKPTSQPERQRRGRNRARHSNKTSARTISF